MREETINLKVGNIARMVGLELTIDHNSTYGGYRLCEGTDYGTVSTSKFGERRRPYGQFIEYLDAIILGLVLAGQTANR